MSNLFISHSSKDNAAAKALQAKLAEQGHRSVFLDLDPDAGIQAGISWERTLYTKLRACRAVVALCSDSYLASQWCFAEVALARMEGKDLFVLQIDPWSEGTEMPSILMEEQFIDLRQNPEDGYHRLWNGFRVKGIVPSEQRDWKPDDPPYPGLRAFHEEDAPIFFGREAEVREGAELMARLRRQGHPRMAMVLGASGSGKSSMVRAGLLPALRRNAREWRIIQPFRPGGAPGQELAISLSAAFDEDGQAVGWQEILSELDPGLATTAPSSDPAPTDEAARAKLAQALEAMESELSQVGGGLIGSLRALQAYLAEPKLVSTRAADVPVLTEVVRRLLRHSPQPDASAVLVIDQFEELLDHPPGHPCSRFLDMLRASLDAEDCPIIAVGTMRSDYLGLLQRAPAMQGLGFRSLSVGPMNRDGMRQVITEPSKLGQIQIEDGLPEMLLDDTETADALPLLAFTLRLMWDRYRADRMLEKREYLELGGLQGAVAQVAEETYRTALERAPDAAAMERALRDAFLAMARPAGGGSGWARQPVNWAQFDAPVQAALEPFVDPQRLLVKREDGSVEVAHEALFRSWDTLKHWLDENAEGLHLRQEIQAEASKWVEAGADQGAYLWKAGRLARAIELRDQGVLALDTDDFAFLDASMAAERAAAEAKEARRQRELRRTRRFAAVLGVLFLISVGIGVFAWTKRNEAAEQTAIAQARTAIGLLATNPVEGLIQAIEAADPSRIVSWRPWPMHPEITTALMTAVRQADAGRIERTALTGHENWVGAVIWHQDGSRLASSDDGGVIRIWSVDGTLLAERDFAEDQLRPIERLAASPDGQFLIGVGDAGIHMLDWDGTVLDHPLRALPLPDWEPETPGAEPELDDLAETLSVAIAPDSRHVAISDDVGRVQIYNLEAPASQPLVLAVPFEEEPPEATALAFSPDGTQLVIGDSDGTLLLVGIDGTPAKLLEGHLDHINALAFSPDGRFLLSASDDQRVRRWDLHAGTGPDNDVPSIAFIGHTNQVLSVAVDAEGLLVASAGEDRTVRLWTIDGARAAPALNGHGGPVFGVAFSPDGRTLASASLDLTVRLWDRPPLTPSHVQVYGVAVSADGTIIASSGEPSSVRLWSPDLTPLPDAKAFTAHPGVTGRIVFTPEGDVVSFGTAGLLASDRAGAAAGRLAPPTGMGRGLAASADGALYGTISLQGRVVIADRSGAEVWSTQLEIAGDAIAIGPDTDGRRLVATGDDNGFIQLWSLEGEPVAEIDQHGDGVYSLAFSRDGTRLISSGRDRMIMIHDLTGPDIGTDSATQIIAGHDDVVSTAQFFLDERFIVSASEDATVRVWRADGTQVAHPLQEHGDWVLWLGLDEANKRVFTAGKDGVLRRWEFDHLDDTPTQLLNRACAVLARHAISADGGSEVIDGLSAAKAMTVCTASEP